MHQFHLLPLFLNCCHRVWLLDVFSAYNITQPEPIKNLVSTMFKHGSHCTRFVETLTTRGEPCVEASLAQGQFRKDVPLRNLKDAVIAVEDLVRPLEGCIEEMVVFHSRDSLLFKEHVQLALKSLTYKVSYFVWCMLGGVGVAILWDLYCDHQLFELRWRGQLHFTFH